MASNQLSQVLDRLEEDEERQQEVLQRRIDAERVELKATMSLSRAAAVASVEQEVALREAREAQAAREQEAPAEKCSSQEKRRLEEEVTALRVQVERLAAASDGIHQPTQPPIPSPMVDAVDTVVVAGGVASAPGSPADGQRPAVADKAAVTEDSSATSSESIGGDAPNEDVDDGSSERSGAEGSGLTRRLVEAETERVLAELKADPPASTKALLLARAELDARASELVAKLNATGLLPPPPPPPSALHEDLGL